MCKTASSYHLKYLLLERIFNVICYFVAKGSSLSMYTVPLKSKLPPLVSFLARCVSFLLRHFSFLARRISFLSRITSALSMDYITHKKLVMCNACCSAVRCQIDGTVQHKMFIDRLLD